MLHPFLLNKRLDLVDFGDVKLFLFQDDNIYRLAVPAARKGQSLRDHYRAIKSQGHRPSFVNLDNAEKVQDSRYCLCLVLAHLWRQGLDFSVLDIGAWVGDFSIKLGNFIRTCGRSNRIYAFDPTEAGALLPYNIRINGLEQFVTHEDIAVSDQPGCLLMNVRPGMSDASFSFNKGRHQFNIPALLRHFWQTRYKRPYLEKLAAYFKPEKTFQILVESTTIADWLRAKKPVGALFVKIDTEGLEMLILRDLLAADESRLVITVFEFNPGAFDSLAQARAELKRLSEKHFIFDIWYSPNPCCCRPVGVSEIDAFVDEIARARIFNYTDILLLPKSLPGVESLAGRLSRLARGPEEYII